MFSNVDLASPKCANVDLIGAKCACNCLLSEH